MTTVAKKNVLDMMDEAIQESAAKATGGFKPTFARRRLCAPSLIWTRLFPS
jgi:hypothetical protein